jgi:hypothetical protein
MALKGRPFAKLGGILKQIAPTAITALAGPAAPLALAVMKGVMGDKGMSDGDLETALVSAAADPSQVVKLKEIEAQLKAQEQATGIRFAELEVEDRQGARQLAIQTSIIPQVVLSALFIVGYFVVLGLFFSERLRVPMNEAFMVMLGVLTAGVPQVMAFWLGSSSGSKAKTDIMAAK